MKISEMVRVAYGEKTLATWAANQENPAYKGVYLWKTGSDTEQYLIPVEALKNGNVKCTGVVVTSGTKFNGPKQVIVDKASTDDVTLVPHDKVPPKALAKLT